jgi:hypothetical protein
MEIFITNINKYTFHNLQVKYKNININNTVCIGVREDSYIYCKIKKRSYTN